jgi:VWFA-related protein
MGNSKQRNRLLRRSIPINMRTSSARRLTAIIAAVLFAASVFIIALSAQDRQNAAQQEAPTFVQTVRIVMAPVSVTDRNGEVVDGLKPSDFRLFDNGKAQKITEDVTSHPLSLVVVVQANATVEKVIPQVQKLGSLLHAQVLGDEGEAAVMSFDHRIQTLSDFTSDPNKLTEALKKIKPGSSSARLNDATINAVNLLKKRPASRRRVILLISESRDQGSELRAREVMNAAEFANTVIYSVNISSLLAQATASIPATRSVLDNRPPGAVHLPAGMVETPTTQSQVAVGNWVPLFKEIFLATKAIFVSNPLEVYTTYTGGREYNFKTQRGLDEAVSKIGADLHSQYLLTYTPNNQDEAGFHNIVVQVAKEGLSVRTRDGYYLAGTPEGSAK